MRGEFQGDDLAVLVTSCHRDRPKQQAIRDTWGRAGLVPFWFFLGCPRIAWAKDEVHVQGDDGYHTVAWKTHRQATFGLYCKWSHVFICDVDTYIDVPLLLKHPRGDYVGASCPGGHISGGCGYFLSQRACEALFAAKPERGYADMWVHSVLDKAGIKPEYDENFGTTITEHLSVDGHYDVEKMYEAHRARTG